MVGAEEGAGGAVGVYFGLLAPEDVGGAGDELGNGVEGDEGADGDDGDEEDPGVFTFA